MTFNQHCLAQSAHDLIKYTVYSFMKGEVDARSHVMHSVALREDIASAEEKKIRVDQQQESNTW